MNPIVSKSSSLGLNDDNTDGIGDITANFAVLKVDMARNDVPQSPIMKKVIDVVDEDGEDGTVTIKGSTGCEKTPRKRVHVKKEGGSAGGKRSSRSWRVKVRKVENINLSTPKEVGMKNAVMMLNEMFPPPAAPQYKVTSMSGTPNNPTFTMTCTLLDQTFSGTGRSKKEAKLAASQEALEKMFGKDFSDGGAAGETSGNTSNPRTLSEIDSWLELEGKNPVSILNELYPGTIFQLVSAEGPSHAPQFCVRATLASVSYEGRGVSKKEAKLHASKALLVHIHRVGFDPMTGDMKSSQGQPDVTRAEGHSWADKVSGLVGNQFKKLFDGTTYSKRKVLAGVVVDQAGVSSVVCVSSGTKCVNGEQICLGGSSLNDCHAEVIARRCLVYWLYGQLEEALLNKTSVLVKNLGGGFSLRQGVSLHLFISTAPCGDARIFSLHEQPVNGLNCLSSHAGSLGEGNRGKLRSKIESGMGTVPLPEEKKLQTWDGVMSGERLLTMACSDKILRWNVVGVQGALLSHWLEPIYFSSITVGSKFHPLHVRRALYGRVGGVDLHLPSGFRLNHPPLLSTTSPEARQASKAQEYSLNWIEGDSPEVVVGAAGKTSTGSPSRICKRSIANRFMKVYRIPGAIQASRASYEGLELEQCSYRQLKNVATDYQNTKAMLVKKLVETGAGHWVEKPVEQDQFYMLQ